MSNNFLKINPEKEADRIKNFIRITLSKEGKKNVVIGVSSSVDSFFEKLEIPKEDILRRGNVMARVRMMILYDLSKKFDALVCGTENRSENLLGYFTRFGDEASDFEPILHLYKTQVYELA